MTLWHTSTELHATRADRAVGATKTVYLAAHGMGRLEAGLGLDLGTEQSTEQSAERDTSG